MPVSPQKRRETERLARMYIAVLAENQDVDDRLNQKRFSSVDWVDIYDRIEAQGVLRFGRGTRIPRTEE